MLKPWLTLAAAASLSACAVGPDYERPQTNASAAFAQQAGYAVDEPVAAFWRGFDDPLLAQLVEGALAHNHDLRAALGRLDQARAIARLSRKDLLPTITAGVSFIHAAWYRFSASSITSATSARRIGPVGRWATIRPRYSALVSSWSLAPMVNAWRGPSKPPFAWLTLVATMASRTACRVSP